MWQKCAAVEGGRKKIGARGKGRYQKRSKQIKDRKIKTKGKRIVSGKTAEFFRETAREGKEQ